MTITLSPKQSAVMNWAAFGKSCRDTAEILGISANTVDFHRKEVAKKLGVSGTTSAVAMLAHHGLIWPAQTDFLKEKAR